MISIAIGSDEAGLDLKEKLINFLKAKSVAVSDYGVFETGPWFYSNTAVGVANAIAAGKHERGILICGTGIGMAISANRVPGIRAAVCHDLYSVERVKKNFDIQILALGTRIITEELAKLLVATWLNAEPRLIF